MNLTVNNATTLDTEPMHLIEADVADHFAYMLELWPRLVRGWGSPTE